MSNPVEDKILAILAKAEIPHARYSGAYRDLCKLAYDCCMLQVKLSDITALDPEKFADEEEE